MAVAATGATAATVIEPRPRLFTIDDLEAMVRAGIIGQDEHVELIEGQIVEMSAQGTRHIWSVSELITTFAGRGVRVTAQSTFQMGERLGPEPDVVVLRADTPKVRKPSPENTLLVVEVADTSLAHDRYTKAPLYARAGIPEYWIVDLTGERIEVYREPAMDGYQSSRVYVRGERLSPMFAPDLVIEVDAILGPATAEG